MQNKIENLKNENDYLQPQIEQLKKSIAVQSELSQIDFKDLKLLLQNNTKFNNSIDRFIYKLGEIQNN